MKKIIPSILTDNPKEANKIFSKLSRITSHLHLDIADNTFVPTSSLNFPLKLSKKFKYHAHLMINDPVKWINKHGKKVDFSIVQLEVIKDIKQHILWLKKIKQKVAFALKPETKITRLKPFLKEVNYILILTVHPGYYGAEFLKYPLNKIKEIKRFNPKIKIIVDGGMKPNTIKYAKWADYIISGSFITKADDPKKAVNELRKALN